MDAIQRKILNCLLDKYESSKSFLGENKRNQSFGERVDKLFPRYEDDADYDFFCKINEALAELERENLVLVSRRKNGVAERVQLQTGLLEKAYRSLDRKSRREEQDQLRVLLESYRSEDKSEIMRKYAAQQLRRIGENRSVALYGGDCEEYADVLRLAEALTGNETECFVRDFSIALFGDSKRAEALRGKASAILYEYGDYEERDSVFEECGVVSTPTYVCVKGNGRLTAAGQQFDLSRMKGDLALSTASLKELENAEVFGGRVVTVENSTSFHDYSNREDFVIYLGGFHNQVKRDFLRFLHVRNPDVRYAHFGDIDAGGFYILEHLRRKTEIAFEPLYMDRRILERYAESVKPLTENDRKRLRNLLLKYEADGRENCEEAETVRYMLDKNCKLEQEVVRDSDKGWVAGSGANAFETR